MTTGPAVAHAPTPLRAHDARVAPPGPLDRHLIRVTTRPDIVFAEGRGSWIVDERGKRYLDLVQGWAVNSLGHAPAVVADAVAAQARRLLSPSPAFHNRPMLELARRLTEVSCFDRVFLASTGAEANEGAVKLARRWGAKHKRGAYEVITFDHGFHGRTLAMMSASGKPGWDTIYAPMPQGFPKARLNDIDSVERAITGRTVAIMLEPVQGEAGVNLVDPSFMRALRALATQHRLLLIVDEVQTGVGRCGTMFAYEQHGIEPDVMTLAKGIGGGVPLSALLCKERFDCFDPGDQGGTYTGNPLAAAAGLAVIDTVCTPGFLARVRERGAQLGAGLARIAGKRGLVGERGAGLLRALVLPTNDADRVVVAARNLEPHGLLLNAPRPNVLRFMPALTIGEDEVGEALGLLEVALDAAARR
jgi:acetylornithine/N-succinyldiaminopimelate aminotransferase